MTARKRTIFEPCDKHAPFLAGETRYRRGEFMVEGGVAGSPCSGDGCVMKPGRDMFAAEFVAAYPIYRSGDDQR